MLGCDVVTHARGGLDSRQALREPPVVGVDWAIYSFGTNDSSVETDTARRVRTELRNAARSHR